RSPEAARGLGNILTQLTGVNNGFVHDSTWWHAWWSKNSGRFSPEIRALAFPKVTLRARPAPPPAFLGNGFVEQPPKPQMPQIANDAKRTYWVIGPPGANGGVRLLTNFAGGRMEVQVLGDLPIQGLVVRAQAAGAAPAQQPAAKDLPGLLVVMPGDGNGADA